MVKSLYTEDVWRKVAEALEHVGVVLSDEDVDKLDIFLYELFKDFTVDTYRNHN